MSQVNIPIVLQVKEAPYNATSPVTLLSDYQARDYGVIIDSVSRRHKTISGSFGTQRMLVSPDVYVSFLDRGGLMGFEVLPWQEGDEDRCKIITITSDEKWTPRRYRETPSNQESRPYQDQDQDQDQVNNVQSNEQGIFKTAQDGEDEEVNGNDEMFQDAQEDMSILWEKNMSPSMGNRFSV